MKNFAILTLSLLIGACATYEVAPVSVSETRSTYLSVDKGNAALCSITAMKTKSRTFAPSGQRSYDITSGLKDAALTKLSLLPHQTRTNDVQVAFAEKNSHISIAIKKPSGQTIQTKKVFFQVDSKATIVTPKMPCGCYPKEDSPLLCRL